MQMKIEVRLVAPNIIESENLSRFDMDIVKNPTIILHFLFTYMKKTTLFTYFA